MSLVNYTYTTSILHYPFSVRFKINLFVPLLITIFCLVVRQCLTSIIDCGTLSSEILEDAIKTNKIFLIMTVFLTLGDGDFSFSLDLVRYLALSSTAKDQVIVSGIDSLKDMQEKYKDCDYIIGQLRSAETDTLSVVICHEINAVSCNHNLATHADVVLFNHPHLGVEDAARHGRFIHHFLRECCRSWLSKKSLTGTVQLTLAAGQWERWNCQEAASKQGFSLKHRVPFVAPPVQDAKYQYRRHQTGKSFRKRTTGSETFVLERCSGGPAHLFAWQLNKLNRGHPILRPEFPCLLCDRTFREERSLKSHLKGFHDESKKWKRQGEIQCEHCQVQGIVKLFFHTQGLSDHVQARHAGIHVAAIRPHWAKTDQPVLPLDSANGRCEVCGYEYRHQNDVLRHAEEFIPTRISLIRQSYVCQFCGKDFHDQRAQLQHENFCNQGQVLLSVGTSIP